MNFSLHYRHIHENNPNNLKVLLVLNLRLAERKHVRVLVYEQDSICDLGNRLVYYLVQHGCFYLPDNYMDYLAQSLVFLIEQKLSEIGSATPPFPYNFTATEGSAQSKPRLEKQQQPALKSPLE